MPGGRPGDRRSGQARATWADYPATLGEALRLLAEERALVQRWCEGEDQRLIELAQALDWR